jgi:hypothetical protein
VFAHACELGAEGVVWKRIDSIYQSGPCRVWIKLRKSRQRRRAAGAVRELEQVIRNTAAVPGINTYAWGSRLRPTLAARIPSRGPGRPQM